MNPFDKMRDLDADGHAYTINVSLLSGDSHHNLAVIANGGTWIQVQEVPKRPFWLNTTMIEVIEIEEQ